MSRAGSSQWALDVLGFLADQKNEDELAAILTGVAAIYPPALFLRDALPAIQQISRLGLAALNSGLLDGTILPDGRGGFISKSWADDPRHWLNHDGSFVD